VTELEPVAPTMPLALTGRAPARDAYALADLMRAQRLPDAALAKTAAWLSGERRQSPRTQAGYIRDLSWWLAYAVARGLDVTDPDPADADLYAAALRDAGLADATRARRLSAASSWYAYLVRAGIATRDPFGAGMERPKAPTDSTTRGMSEDEIERMLAYARAKESARTYALLTLMVNTAARVSGATQTTVGSIGHDSGHKVIDLPVKGGKTKRFLLPPMAVDAIDVYLAGRGEVTPSAPLFATRTGKPIDQPYVFRLVRRVAKAAGVPHADKLSPHSIRHSIITYLLSKGKPTHIVQDFAGHADPRTTRRYDRAAGNLDRSPAYEIGAAMAAGVDRYAEAYAQDAPLPRPEDLQKETTDG
jgi:integrase/recombinase XerD